MSAQGILFTPYSIRRWDKNAKSFVYADNTLACINSFCELWNHSLSQVGATCWEMIITLRQAGGEIPYSAAVENHAPPQSFERFGNDRVHETLMLGPDLQNYATKNNFRTIGGTHS